MRRSMQDYKVSAADWTNTKGLSGVLNIEQDDPRPGPIDRFIRTETNGIPAELETHIHIPTDVKPADVTLSQVFEDQQIGIFSVTINRNGPDDDKFAGISIVKKLQVTLWFNEQACDVANTAMQVQCGRIILTTPRDPASLESARCEAT